MVVVNETKRGQLLALLEQCAHLNADVRPRTDKGYFTVTVPPPWNGPAQRKAQEVQDRIKKWSEQYPNVICYCFDSFSTLPCGRSAPCLTVNMRTSNRRRNFCSNGRRS